MSTIEEKPQLSWSRVELEYPITCDQLSWLHEKYRNLHDFYIEPEYDCDDDGYETSDVLRATVVFRSTHASTMFILACM